MDTLKNRKRICSSIDKELYKRLHEYSKESMIPISKLLDEAIKNILTEK